MHLHLLGVCGTFMGGLAALAKAAGHTVTGADQNVYPPMSTQLRKLGVRIHEGYDAGQVPESVDCVVVGNVMRRGQPVIEELLDSGRAYESGPAWLARHVLAGRWVLAVAGTHGKTTTASMLAWILEYAGLSPGFLIGGVPRNFGISARLGEGRFFVIEADEYDTAFFDKRAKFVHYRPRTLAITNIEYDHADIYRDVDAILWQFHQLMRTLPGRGLMIANAADANIERMLEMGCWTPLERFTTEAQRQADWHGGYELVGAKSRFAVSVAGQPAGTAVWALAGQHNLQNALAAVAAARHAGVPVDTALKALAEFQGVRRRLERRGRFQGVTLYDDFAHHPTAIRETLAALRSQQPDRRLVAVLEPRSNTMRQGAHVGALAGALEAADRVHLFRPPELGWTPAEALAALGERLVVTDDVDALVARLADELVEGDEVVIMSNGAFGGLPRKLEQALKGRAPITSNGRESS
ncbi:MAG: UDP-N-acetylmuramate:L-alanyl-gamma-D-glutamyl-meso-diaminopimelate ligase [Gammaproteobacteria bacterium]|nr:UDP-N-acetylmuramate:L-alanyl-gamma-D-glutamyl-meso-diaminopimelate ligase [Gammaproteobacteria bacterium]